MTDDPIAPARGCFHGLLIGCLFELVLIALAIAVVRWWL